MTDAELMNLEKRLASLPDGPWRWSHSYGIAGSWRWCLENKAFAEEGKTIDIYSVTETAQSITTFEEVRDMHVCDTPVMSFLANSRALVDTLLAEVKQWREVFANDCLVDSPALQMAHLAGQEAMLERIVRALEANNLRTTAILVRQVEAISP